MTAARDPAAPAVRPPSRRARRRLPASLFAGGLLVLAVVSAALLSLAWTPWPTDAVDLAARLRPPSAAHWLGTDALGRDVASLLLAGARGSLLAGAVAVAIGLAGGTALGLWAAARGGWADALAMRLADLTFAFPALLTAIVLAALYGAGLVNAVAAVGVAGIPVFARLSRAAAGGVWSRDFVLAARAAGFGRWRITRDHVLPNILPLLAVQATLQFAVAILAEAALSYLGLGAQPPAPSWGRMLAEAQTLMFQAPLLAVFPGAAIALAVLGTNLLGDGLRDLLDPRLAGRR
jgi:peptide/nickel transport system permease protein